RHTGGFGEPEHSSHAVGPAEIGCAIEVSILSLNQAVVRIRSIKAIHGVEGMQGREDSTWSNGEDSALVTHSISHRASRVGGAVEVSVSRENEPVSGACTFRRRTSNTGKLVQHGELPGRADPKNRATA